MRFVRYLTLGSFAADIRDILLADEAQNNLPLSLLSNLTADTADWLMATVQEDDGRILLTAVCTPPFNILLYETGNKPHDAAVTLLSDSLKDFGFVLPGVLAEKNLARRFAQIHAGANRFYNHLSLNLMRLDTVTDLPAGPGYCRPLRENDLHFAPYWERAFAEECRTKVFDIQQNVERLRLRMAHGTHFIWEDGQPVSQAAQGRGTPHGAVVSNVYTPPHYRGQGYATALVSALSRTLLARGHQFCCLFADADNPVSCGIYHKIGYRNLCAFAELRFTDR